MTAATTAGTAAPSALSRVRSGAPAAVWETFPTLRGLSIDYGVVWSGERFIYPYVDHRGSTESASLLPIDCRPSER